jgi:hypothetical protein
MQQMVGKFGELEVVAVRPLRTQPQIRELAQCHGFLAYRLDSNDGPNDEIMGLIEWLDLGSFPLSEDTISDFTKTGQRRKLYKDILTSVHNKERRGYTVLAGVMNVPRPGIPEWRVAVLSVCPRAAGPGAIKRRNILVDRRCVTPGNYGLLPGDEP